MESILERYERYSYAEKQLTAPDPDSHASWTLEYAKLKARLEILQKNHKHYVGQELDSLSLKELQSLEQQLDSALKHIRSKKNQLMYESISELQKKDKALQEHNNLLSKKVKEKEKVMAQNQQAQWDRQQSLDLNPSAFLMSQPLPSFNIGGRYEGVGGTSIGSEEGMQQSGSNQAVAALMPSWMLPHIPDNQ